MHPDETRLNDYLDNVLDEREQQSIAAHAQSCARCAGEIAALRTLRARLAALPTDIKPERDLRAEIWQKIEAPTPLWSMRYRLAAAAVLLIAVTSVVTMMLMRNGGRSDFAQQHRNDAVHLVGNDPRTIERQYSDEVKDLESVLRNSRGALSPETVRILEENLHIIDNAIREAQTALASDPNSAMLVDLLRSAYERKLELLQQAAKSSPAT
jgi:hypothetical protein